MSSRSKRKARPKNRAMVVLLECRYGDLYASANAAMESLAQWKAAQHQSRGQENLLVRRLTLRRQVDDKDRYCVEFAANVTPQSLEPQ
jgi:hypothetical protein